MPDQLNVFLMGAVQVASGCWLGAKWLLLARHGKRPQQENERTQNP
jgi:formylmethanofuran dehydrogenase subunit E